VRRAYTFRLRPMARQHVALVQCPAAHRELYNAALQERRDAWRLRGIGISYGEQSAQLKALREVRPDVGVWSFSSQQATLRRLNRAFTAFFRRVRVGSTPGYPRFKPAHRFDSVEWPKDGDGCRWKPDTGRVYLQGIGHVKVTVHRRVEGRVKTIQVRRQGRRWLLVLSCDQVPIRPLEPTQSAVGIDLGIASFATTSDSQHVPNPGWNRVAAERLASAQQALARKERGSNNRRRARATLAARHRKLANQRRNFHRASQAVFSCRACGHTANADEHAARNILRAGLAHLAATSAA
jgi:putative transposase